MLPFQVLITVIALVVLSILILPRVSNQLGQLAHQQRPLFWKLYLANGIQAGLGTSLAMIGIALTDAINAGFLVKFTAVTTILFAWIMLKEKMTPLKLATMLLMISGVYLLTTKGQALVPRPGDIFLIAACIFWSLGSVMVRKYLKNQPLDPDVVTMQKPLASLPVLLLLVGLVSVYTNFSTTPDPLFRCCSIKPADFIYGVLTGICLAMAWIFIYRTLKVSTASYLTLMSMMTPVLVSILAIIFIGESLLMIQAVGAGLIIISGVMIYYSDMAYV